MSIKYEFRETAWKFPKENQAKASRGKIGNEFREAESEGKENP